MARYGEIHLSQQPAEQTKQLREAAEWAAAQQSGTPTLPGYVVPERAKPRGGNGKVQGRTR